MIFCIVSIFLLLHIEGYAQQKAIILKNVNVVDVVQGNIHRGVDIVVKDGIIQAVGKNVGNGIVGNVEGFGGNVRDAGID